MRKHALLLVAVVLVAAGSFVGVRSAQAGSFSTDFWGCDWSGGATFVGLYDGVGWTSGDDTWCISDLCIYFSYRWNGTWTNLPWPWEYDDYVQRTRYPRRTCTGSTRST
jgi:hypothetical protein